MRHPDALRERQGIPGMTQAYLRTTDAAKYLGIGQSTLERKRIDGSGPTFRQLGSRMVAYAVSDLDAWASQRVLNSTSERAAA
ncbi:helix-turn-helix transcriptional regulator [Sphingomonas faeni]|uniref:helix-turn-helix transcriptional regulator n=1 Tax=Sphingomonas faeni TaxID=185950 RepID=UPI003593C35D